MKREQLEHVLRSAAPGRGYLLDPHHCVVSKLVAGREKGHAFAAVLIEHGLVDPTVIMERIETVEVPDAVRQRMRSWIRTHG